MKPTRQFLLTICVLMALTGCESLGLGDVIEIAQKSAPAVKKSFEDILLVPDHSGLLSISWESR